VPELNGLACGNGAGAIYTYTGAADGCGTSHLDTDLVLHHIGWQSVDVDVPMDPGLLGHHSGFLTMGDNNFDNGNTGDGLSDQYAGLSTLVEPGWIIGVARGMVPWFGAIKLALDGNSDEVPSQSWQYLGVTIAGIVLAALALHLFLRAEGVEDPRRKAEEEREEGDEEPPRRGLAGLFHRRKPPSGPDDAEEEERPRRHTAPRDAKGPTRSERRRGGRPKPKVGREAAEDGDEATDADDPDGEPADGE